MRLGIPASLKVTVPLILLGFAATLSTVNLLYHVPEAERAAEEDGRKRLAQEMSRLQSTLEYLLLKGDAAAAEHEIAVLAHNHDVTFAALTDDAQAVVTATRHASLGRPIADVLPQFDLREAAAKVRERRAGMSVDSNGDELLGHAGILIGRDPQQLRPSRTGSVFLVYDLKRYKAEARAQVVQQSIYWAGWVTALALAMWLVFHFLLTRRTAGLVEAAERFASGNLGALSRLAGRDELGRLSRAFDAMAVRVAETQTRLRQDIAERAKVQRALEDSEARLQQILDNAPAVVSVKDTAGRFLFVNREWEQVFGRGHAEVIGRTDRETLATDVAAQIRANDLLVLGRNAPMEFEESAQLADGVHTYISIKFPLHDASGRAYAVCAISTDISARKRSDEELARQRDALHQREKLAALGSLLAGVAHELNNPLSVVVARAVMLEEQGDHATRAAAVKIRSAAERCSRIVRMFLAMARQQEPQRGPVAINEVIGAALDITAYAMRTNGIEVALDLAGDIPLIRADADQLHQVLLNLIINAQQALQERPAPRRLAVSSLYQAEARAVRVEVADNGPGIPADLRARVFEPYFTTKPTGSGLGVGLAVSLGIVESHGGTLSVDCPDGGGAVFSITLPVGRIDSAQASPETCAAADSAAGSVLVVDDELEIRETLNEILTGARHRVVAVASGREALQRIAAEHYDVILTDIRMADVDGRALYREIQRQWPRKAARVVFVTGDTLASDLREFVSESGRPVIEKPFLPSEVRRVVAQLAAL